MIVDDLHVSHMLTTCSWKDDIRFGKILKDGSDFFCELVCVLGSGFEFRSARMAVMHLLCKQTELCIRKKSISKMVYCMM